MYLRNMTRQEYLDFLVQHADVVLDNLLTTNSYLLDCIVIDELQEEFLEYQKECGDHWEAC
jgi:DNA-dependent RNA polymerase auxiliary subunit epsilon